MKTKLTSFLLFLFLFGKAQTEVVLRKSFVDSLKNRITYSGNFTLEFAHDHPNPASEDGDMHIAVMEPGIGLPMVAELMNAESETDAVDFIHSKTGTNESVRMSGVWRLWPEHPGHLPQVQGKKLTPYTNTNPDHVFEIHPITSIEEMKLHRTLHTIEGYEAHEEVAAFKHYMNIKGIVKAAENKRISIAAKKGMYNYAEFRIKVLDEEQKVVKDGRFVNVAVIDNHNKVIDNIRLAIVKDSKADKIFRHLAKGSKLHILGIPRLNLNEISKMAASGGSNSLIKLPVEMIVAGVYSD